MKAKITIKRFLHSLCFTLIYFVFLFCLHLSLFLFLFPFKEQLIYHDIRKEHFLERRLPVLIHKAVVTFIDASRTENVVFDSGVQTDTGFLIFTHRLQIMPQSNELMFTIKDLQSSDVGRYEISGLGGLAAVIWLSESSGKFYFCSF